MNLEERKEQGKRNKREGWRGKGYRGKGRRVKEKVHLRDEKAADNANVTIFLNFAASVPTPSLIRAKY